MSAQSTIAEKFGLPNDNYFNTHCILWEAAKDHPWLSKVINTATGKGVTKIYINRDFKDKLSKAFRELEKDCLHKEIRTFDGCFNERSVRGSSTTSLHAWAMAVDLNSEIEQLGESRTYWSEDFLYVMKEIGLFWGGDWVTRKDSMHFALYNG